MRKTTWLLAAAALLLTLPTARAQTADTATLQGTIRDANHSAVAGAQVTAHNTQTGAERATTSTADGRYVLAGLPVAGSWTLQATASGLAPAQAPNLTLMSGVTATIDLTVGVPENKSVVTVTGVVGEVRADEPQLGDRLGQSEIEQTPLLGNQITGLPLLNSANRPAINMGDTFMNETLFTTNGGGRRQTSFTIDGANGNDDWGRQTIFTNIPAGAVQEMTVLENAYSAEYGNSTGGAVNIVTTSGTQQLHGSGTYTVRPNGLAASLSGYATGSTTSHPTNDVFNQGDWTLAGPIGDKTEFALAGEVTRRQRASPVTSPLAPGVFNGTYAGGLLFARVDHQINADQSWFVRTDVDSFYDSNPNGSVGGNTLPTTDRVFKRHTYSAVAGETAALSPDWVNALRLQFQIASPITAFAPVNDSTAYVVPIVGYQTFTSGTSQSANLVNRQYELSDTVNANLGSHALTFGADAIVGRDGGNSKEFGGPTYLGTFTFAACNNTPAYCESPAYLDNIANVASFSQSFGDANYSVSDTVGSLFVQDDWQARPGLTLNLGLRYERQTFTDGKKNFAPRLGFAWSPNPKTVVRGGYGIYYSEIVDNNEANYALTGPTGVFNFTATPGQVGFPTSVVAYTSLPAGVTPPLRSLYIRPGEAAYYNQFFPTSLLEGFPSALENPYSEQWTLGIERRLPGAWVVQADYVGSRTLRIDRPLDVDPPTPFVRTQPNQWRGVTNNSNGTFTCQATGQTGNLSVSQLTACAANAANASRPLWIYDAAQGITPAYSVIQSTVNDGEAWYDALEINANHAFRHGLEALISYTWSHSISTVDPDSTGQNPNDPNFTGTLEKGNTLFDQRHRLVVSGTYSGPLKIEMGGIATLASAEPYNLVTGTTNGGDTGAETDRPVVNGVVVGRDTGQGAAIYSFDPFVERSWPLGERLRLNLRAESFNILNHANFVSYVGTYGNGATAAAGVGAPVFGLASQLPPREFQFSATVSF